MAKKKREGPSVASMIREILERNAEVTLTEAQTELKTKGIKCTPQNFYGTRYTWKKQRVRPVGVPQKRRAKPRHLVHENPIGDSEIQLAILRRENKKLKDIIMRFMLD